MSSRLPHIRILVTSLLLAASGCTGMVPARVNSGRDGAHLTGGKTSDGRNLTTASADGEIEIIKTKIEANETNLALAGAVLDAKIELVDRSGKAVTKNPERLKIEVSLKAGYVNTTKLEFDVPLTATSDDGLEFKNISSGKGNGFRLSGTCATRECEKVVLRLDRAITNSLSAKAGFIVRTRGVTATMAGEANAKDLARAAHLSEINDSLASNRVTGNLRTFEVAYGVSHFSTHLTTLHQELCLNGLLVETADSDESIHIVSCKTQASIGMQAVMIGNDGSGSIALRLQEGGAELYVLLVAEGDPVLTQPDEQGPVAPPPPIISGNVRLPVDEANPLTLQLERDRNRPEVQETIESYWLGSMKAPLGQFVTRIQPNLPVLTAGLSASGVPNIFVIITLTESAFFKQPGYPMQVTDDPKSTATGPWQITYDTASDPRIGPRALKNTEVRRFKDKSGTLHVVKKADECDERRYLKESTLAAGRYFKILLGAFDQDVKLAVMAYHDGTTGVRKHLDKAKRLDDVKNMKKIDFWIVRKFNLASKTSTDYVVRFVAAQFVARDPTRYGLNPPTLFADSAPAPVKPAICKN